MQQICLEHVEEPSELVIDTREAWRANSKEILQLPTHANITDGGELPPTERHTNTSGPPTSGCGSQSRILDNLLDVFAMQLRPVQSRLIGRPACGCASSKVG